ncbi:DNA repair protein RecN [Peptostreptococcus equinus]|uniref:DNA repair protein RecN n=1 Tax=Peptostreptococcus equinus TaxID=3003601 RepID=A0ABY7JTZ3_9FIRM|nr:DNA repair protein RecN [Peptostreptococcus sp. CBA3647]WAW15623.1 DNA repair protein RecN [Peptostreptococcus sp. CBA3647]
MIYELYIKNCALIEEARVNFENKLNILTGETGSGKSIVLGALNLCLGGKYDRSFIRKSCSEGQVELMLFTKNKSFIKALSDLNIDIDESGQVIVNRKLYEDGKTVAKVNGKNIRINDLKNLMSHIVDMHGQNQNQVLYNKEKHIEFLDLFSKDKIKVSIEKYSKEYDRYLDIKGQIKSLNDNKSEQELQREIDLLKFQIEEIEAANLNEDNYQDLLKKKDIFENSEKIYKELAYCFEILHEKESNAIDLLGTVSNSTQRVANFDDNLGQIYELSERVMIDSQELSYQIRNYMESLNFEPYMLEEIQESLDVVNNLRRKYGDTIEEIFKYLDKIKNRLSDIENRTEKNEKLNKELIEQEKRLSKVADQLTVKRQEMAVLLENSLKEELISLNMKNTRFKVMFNKIVYNDQGQDDVEFFVSFNIGENLNPLNKVASGGEMSRFVLAFKKILSDVDKIETMVFDEIDIGISGRAAQIVGEKLSAIAREKQIICITHLPQIASFADQHYYIEKNVENKRTYTNVSVIEDRKQEIARLISGKIISKKTLEHADEMIKLANEIKKFGGK